MPLAWAIKMRCFPPDIMQLFGLISSLFLRKYMIYMSRHHCWMFKLTPNRDKGSGSHTPLSLQALCKLLAASPTSNFTFPSFSSLLNRLIERKSKLRLRGIPWMSQRSIYVGNSWLFSIPDRDYANKTQTERSPLQHGLYLSSRKPKCF